MTETVTTIDLIRHGEPVGGSGRYRGQIDDPLSEKGWQQMREAVADACPWQSIVSSPLSRCAAFAEELSQRHDLPLVLNESLQEIGFGEWEGLTKAEISNNDPEALHRFYDDPVANSPPGAETLQQFQTRIKEAWNAVAASHVGEHVLVVAHAGVIRMIVCYVLATPLQSMFRIHVPNAGISRIRIDGEGERALTSLMFHGGSL